MVRLFTILLIFSASGCLEVTNNINTDINDQSTDAGAISSTENTSPTNSIIDTDLDGVIDTLDNCLLDSNADQLDTDSDGTGDICDLDNDNDSIPDITDNCPLISNVLQIDTDGDSLGDNCDNDDDGDGKLDTSDNCQLIANVGQENIDNDSLGDLCDDDNDNDGWTDLMEQACFSDELDYFDQPMDIDKDGICNANDSVFVGSKIFYNQSDVNEIEHIRRVVGHIQISDNDDAVSSEITDITPFMSVTEITGELGIYRNEVLADLKGLENLKIIGSGIGGGLTINGNEKLEQIDGLRELEWVGDELVVSYNPSITSISGFLSLSYVSDYVGISENPLLENILGLSAVTEVNWIYIFNNDSLCQSKVDTYVATVTVVNGPIQIYGNDTGC